MKYIFKKKIIPKVYLQFVGEIIWFIGICLMLLLPNLLYWRVAFLIDFETIFCYCMVKSSQSLFFLVSFKQLFKFSSLGVSCLSMLFAKDTHGTDPLCKELLVQNTTIKFTPHLSFHIFFIEFKQGSFNLFHEIPYYRLWSMHKINESDVLLFSSSLHQQYRIRRYSRKTWIDKFCCKIILNWFFSTYLEPEWQSSNYLST